MITMMMMMVVMSKMMMTIMKMMTMMMMVMMMIMTMMMMTAMMIMMMVIVLMMMMVKPWAGAHRGEVGVRGQRGVRAMPVLRYHGPDRGAGRLQAGWRSARRCQDVRLP